MNRNIITANDVIAFANATTPAAIPRTLASDPPAGAPPVGSQAVALPHPPVPTEDDFLTRLLKYVPPEILGIYLFSAGIIDSNVQDRRPHAIWLLALLAFVAVLIVPYDLVVLDVVRPTQIAMSVAGFGVYVFALGGWFATTTWYHQWYASLLLPIFALLVALFRLKPLPATGD